MNLAKYLSGIASGLLLFNSSASANPIDCKKINSVAGKEGFPYSELTPQSLRRLNENNGFDRKPNDVIPYYSNSQDPKNCAPNGLFLSSESNNWFKKINVLEANDASRQKQVNAGYYGATKDDVNSKVSKVTQEEKKDENQKKEKPNKHKPFNSWAGKYQL